MINKPYAESCDQNRDPILAVIAPLFADCSAILEVASGTGQHAVYFAKKMPHLTWYCSDRHPQLDGINTWLNDAGLPNVVTAFELDVSTSRWPLIDVDAVFTANSLHIMHQRDVVNLMAGAGRLLKPGGSLVIYGPFNYNGSYTSASNASFDTMLKQRDPDSGIKACEEITRLANDNGMNLVTDYEMPVNNRILHFSRSGDAS